ncbi:MAG: hypothetical protein SAJ12_17550 [Jaaginema sp. PMC 1079.18]|nr:hypothetical protein [Jaaginema sp. PMC 1080.18]MEC4852787.1 hypothetical protein [Jaaginema sp. PMC 1079.18]
MKKLALGLSLCLGLGLGGNVTSWDAIAFAQTEVVQEDSNAVNSSVGVVLLEAGTGEKQELRLRPEVGETQTLNVAVKMNIEMFFGGMSMPSIPDMTTQLTLKSVVTDVKDNGDIEAEFIYTDISVLPGESIEIPPEVIEAMNTELTTLIGTKGTFLLDDRGRTKAINLELAEDVNPMFENTLNQLMASFENISSPLPEEAVGVGAMWQVEQEINLNGLMLDQTAVYTLEDRTNETVVLSMIINQSGEKQQFTPLGLSESMIVDLVSLESTGTGKLTMSLSQLLPINADMNLVTRSQMNIPTDRENATTSMRTNTEMDLIMISEN